MLRNLVRKKLHIRSFLVSTCLITLFMVSSVFAWDYQNLQMGSNIRWQRTSIVNGVKVCDLKVNGDYLNSNWSAGYNSGYQKWNSTKVKAVNSSFSTSNVDYYTPVQSQWPANFDAQGIYAVAVLVDSDGTADYEYGFTGKVTYVQVATTPNLTSGNSASTIAVVLGHEIGHALCLKDVSYTDSYMCAGYLAAPSSGDLLAISNMYK